MSKALAREEKLIALSSMDSEQIRFRPRHQVDHRRPPFPDALRKPERRHDARHQGESGIDARLSTTGGTSDGRSIADICPQGNEFGPPNESIHKIDENVELRHIDPLKNIYRRTPENLLL